MTEDQQSQIDYVIDNFNFEKVVLVMTTLDWGWAPESGESGTSVPSISRLRSMARYLLKKSIDDRVTGTGGLQASYCSEDDMFSLCFIIEEQDSEFWLD